MAQQPLNIGEYSVYLEETNSTNDALKLLYSAENIPEGSVVYAGFQSKGRGQQSNSWESNAGENLLMSVLLQPQFLQADEQVWLNIVVSLAMQAAAEELSGLEVAIKWPNDIFIEEKKVGGILIENVLQGSRIRYAIVGFGLNLNQQTFTVEKASSLSLLSGNRVDPKDARLKLSAKLEHYYSLLRGKQYNLLWERYHQYLLGRGKEARFKQNETEFVATIMGIDKKGKLHLLINDDIKSFAHKEVEFLGLIN